MEDLKKISFISFRTQIIFCNRRVFVKKIPNLTKCSFLITNDLAQNANQRTRQSSGFLRFSGSPQCGAF